VEIDLIIRLIACYILQKVIDVNMYCSEFCRNNPFCMTGACIYIVYSPYNISCVIIGPVICEHNLKHLFSA